MSAYEHHCTVEPPLTSPPRRPHTTPRPPHHDHHHHDHHHHPQGDGTLDFEMLRETDVGPDFTDIYDDLYKSVHHFRRRLEEKFMTPVFGPSSERWKIRKKELIQTLRDGGYTSFAQSFYSHLKFNGLQHQRSFAEKAFYEGVHVLDHPGHDTDEVSKHKRRETKHVRSNKSKKSSSRSNRAARQQSSGPVNTRSNRSGRAEKLDSVVKEEEEEEGERAAAEKEREHEAATEDAAVVAGSFKNQPISFMASPGGDGVSRDLPSAPPVSSVHK
jgi:hypothetical protein